MCQKQNGEENGEGRARRLPSRPGEDRGREKSFGRGDQKSRNRVTEKANKRKSTGITGITSTIGRNAAYGSGSADSKKFTFI